MRRGFVVAGGLLVLLGAALQGVAQHDGIVGVTSPEAFPAPGQSADGLRSRLIVDGTPSTTAAFVEDLRDRGYQLSGVNAEGEYTRVTAHFAAPGSSAIILLRVSIPPPEIGKTIIVEGSARNFQAPPGVQSGAPILWFDAQEIAQPILFKGE